MCQKPMNCDLCIQILGIRIKSPNDLKRAINKAAELVTSEVLTYEGAGQYGVPFSRLASGGHWGDFVNNYFSCRSCGQLFHLHAETYHGSGGAFERIDKIEEEVRGDTSAT